MVARPTHRSGLQVAAGERPGTILLSGELDLASAGTLTGFLRRARCAAGARMVVDLGGLTFMDVAGLRALEAAQRSLLDDGVRLVLHGARGEPARLLALAGGLPGQ